jgi:hypothetical protein
MHTRLAALTFLAVLAAACGDSDSRPTLAGPQPLQLAATTTFAALQPSTLTSELSRGGACPDSQPFRATAGLRVIGDNDTVLAIDSIRLEFFDQQRNAAPAVTLTAPVLTRQFGSALVEARSSRTFPIGFGFGCSTGRTGTIVVVVVARDGNGRDRSMQLRAAVQ